MNTDATVIVDGKYYSVDEIKQKVLTTAVTMHHAIDGKLYSEDAIKALCNPIHRFRVGDVFHLRTCFKKYLYMIVKVDGKAQILNLQYASSWKNRSQIDLNDYLLDTECFNRAHVSNVEIIERPAIQFGNRRIGLGYRVGL